MSKETREHLSALVDGEISRETSRFLVRRLGTDDELRATWARYHLVRDCLRHQDGSIAGEDLCARVSSALENEQPGTSTRVLRAGWLKPVTGVAIAASVALMAIVAVGPRISGMPAAPESVANQPQAEPFTSPQSLIAAPFSSQASLAGRSNSQSRKMDSYVLRHYQATGTTGGKGFVTFVPIVITRSASGVEQDGKATDSDSDISKDEEAGLR